MFILKLESKAPHSLILIKDQIINIDYYYYILIKLTYAIIIYQLVIQSILCKILNQEN